MFNRLRCRAGSCSIVLLLAVTSNFLPAQAHAASVLDEWKALPAKVFACMKRMVESVDGPIEKIIAAGIRPSATPYAPGMATCQKYADLRQSYACELNDASGQVVSTLCREYFAVLRNGTWTEIDPDIALDTIINQREDVRLALVETNDGLRQRQEQIAAELNVRDEVDADNEADSARDYGKYEVTKDLEAPTGSGSDLAVDQVPSLVSGEFLHPPISYNMSKMQLTCSTALPPADFARYQDLLSRAYDGVEQIRDQDQLDNTEYEETFKKTRMLFLSAYVLGNSILSSTRGDCRSLSTILATMTLMPLSGAFDNDELSSDLLKQANDAVLLYPKNSIAIEARIEIKYFDETHNGNGIILDHSKRELIVMLEDLDILDEMTGKNARNSFWRASALMWLGRYEEARLAAQEAADLKDPQYEAYRAGADSLSDDISKRYEAAHAKHKWTYEAVISCGQGSVALVACFVGKSGITTELEIKRDNVHKVYQAPQLSSIRATDGLLSLSQDIDLPDGMIIDSEGLHILLPEHFAIRAQNTQEYLVLGIRVIEMSTRKTVFQQEAGRFGVIAISN